MKERKKIEKENHKQKMKNENKVIHAIVEHLKYAFKPIVLRAKKYVNEYLKHTCAYATKQACKQRERERQGERKRERESKTIAWQKIYNQGMSLNGF